MYFSVIDSPFQTFAVGLLLVKFIALLYHCFLHKLFLRRVNYGFSYNIMRPLLYFSGWMTQLHPHKCICKYRLLVNWNYPWKLEHYRSLLQQAELLQTGKKYEGAPL